jgi:hypothetical protein
MFRGGEVISLTEKLRTKTERVDLVAQEYVFMWPGKTVRRKVLWEETDVTSAVIRGRQAKS